MTLKLLTLMKTELQLQTDIRNDYPIKKMFTDLHIIMLDLLNKNNLHQKFIINDIINTQEIS